MLYLIYLLILFILITLYFRVASRFDIVDEPGERSSHIRPVIRGAGVIFPLGILLWFFWSGFQYPWFVTGLMLISLVSFIDDLSHVMRGIRLLTQLTAIILLLMQVGFPYAPWWIWGVTLFMAIGIINAFNFMDGINGMTAGYSLSVLIALWYVNNFLVPFIANDLLCAAGIAILLFGFYNFRTHARCFAGDVGPVSISFILIFLISKLILVSGNLSYLMFLIIYGIDTFYTLSKRLIRRENIVKPHRQHLYQILANESGFTHVKVSTAYALAQLLINLLIIAMAGQISIHYQLMISVGIIITLAAIYIIIKKSLTLNT